MNPRHNRSQLENGLTDFLPIFGKNISDKIGHQMTIYVHTCFCTTWKK